MKEEEINNIYSNVCSLYCENINIDEDGMEIITCNPQCNCEDLIMSWMHILHPSCRTYKNFRIKKAQEAVNIINENKNRVLDCGHKWPIK
jgi:hypothetical protein